MDEVAALLDTLLTRPTTTPGIDDAQGWWALHREVTRGGGSSASRAVLGGFAADRLGYAFASGYTEALRGLLHDEGPPRRRALCASEAKGAHPRAIECALTLDEGGGGRMSGHKSFVTLGPLATELLIVASVGQDERGRNRLRVARIPSQREGLSFTCASSSFVPEIPHASLSLHEVEVGTDELLDGDGYLEVLKPFRTIEDTHVHLALLGWLTKLGRAARWPDEAIERGLALMVGLLPLASSRTPLSPGVHRALGGALAGLHTHLLELERGPAWMQLPARTRALWARDRRLLDVAHRARARRLEVARG